MKYIDLEKGVFIHPEEENESEIEINQDSDGYYLHIVSYSNDKPFRLLDVDPKEYCENLGLCVSDGVWPETKCKSDFLKIIEALNKDLSKKFGAVLTTINDLPW